MAKSPTYNKAAVDKQLKKDGVSKPKATKLTHKILKGRQKTDEADGVSDADRNPSIERSKYKTTYKTYKATDSDNERGDKKRGLPMDDMSIAKRKKERNMFGEAATEADKYRVTAKSNDDDKGFKSGIKSKADADTTAEKMKKQTRKDGAKMYNSVKVVKESKLTEGVLDDIDDDGFMAKRQLYDLAKHSVALHRTIQDTDNLEPWVQAKITKAADYIDTVKHYLEYQDVRGGEEATVDFGMDDDIADIDQTLDQMAPTQKAAPMEDYMEDDYEDDYYEETYESLNVTESKAKEIYKKMMSGLKGKK